MKIEVYEDKARKKLTEDTGRPIQTWTFKVDGQESGFWSFRQYDVERCISRLKEGRSSEAFGDVVDVLSNGIKVAEARVGPKQGRATVTQFTPQVQQSTRKMKSGAHKPAVVRDMYRAEVDGQHIGDFATQKEARSACAFKAFMTRGKAKLNGQTVETAQGKKLTVTYTGKGIKAVDEEGNQHAFGFRKDGNHIVKPIMPSEGNGDA